MSYASPSPAHGGRGRDGADVSDGRANLDGGGYRQRANSEPLPGYRLLDHLGRGGFGEVWKCEAPGGLLKAIKFVYPDSEADDAPGDSLRQEYEAFQHIKTIRHPFLLMLERVELIDGVLASVMELADAGLQDRFQECLELGLKGIPRAELLGYLTDAAEALDVISVKHGLQHLDIKPANLFLVAGHVKVGDYGLVSRSNPTAGRHGAGFTPRYAPPELIDGMVDPRSDQYSLALVYFEMLTGGFPFNATSAKDLMMSHAALDPNLSTLPPGDRPVVARALAKDPAERFPNCLGFIRALLSAGPPPPSDVTLRQARMGQKPLPPGLSGVAQGGTGAESAITRSRMPASSMGSTPTLTLRTPRQSGIVSSGNLPRLSTPVSQSSVILPHLASHAAPTPGPAAINFETPRPKAVDQPTGPTTPDLGSMAVVELTPAPAAGPVHKLPHGFQAVLPVPLLTGGVWSGAAPPTGGAFAFILFEAVYGSGQLPTHATDPIRQPDGSWVCRFPAKLMAGTVRLKLQAVRDEWGGELLQPDPCRFQLRLGLGKGRSSWLSRAEPTGLAVDLQLPPPALANGDVLVTGRPFGPADNWVQKKASDELPHILIDLRKQLQNLPDRRKAPRVPYDGPIQLYPVDEDGGVFAPVPGRAVDVSPTGVCCLPSGPVASRYVYIEFPRITPLAGLAVLVELLRRGTPANGEEPVAGMYRVDLDGPVAAVTSAPDLKVAYY